MKKLLVLSALIISTLTVSAQYESGTLSVQPRVGATGAFLTNTPDLKIEGLDKTIDAEPTGGVIVGADLEYQVSPMFSLSAGVNWAQAGSGWKDTKFKSQGVNVELKDFKVETSYLNVPVTANIYVWKGLALRTGVQMGFLTSAKTKATIAGSASEGGTNYKEKIEMDQSCKDEFKNFDISIPVGVSYEFNNHLVVDMRYNIGVTKVNKNSTADEKDSRNGVLALTIGYKIKL